MSSTLKKLDILACICGVIMEGIWDLGVVSPRDFLLATGAPHLCTYFTLPTIVYIL